MSRASVWATVRCWIEPDVALACAGFALVFWLALYHGPTSRATFTDVYIYREYARLMLEQGLLPYQGFELEYPPLAAAVFALPGLASTGNGYGGAFSAEILLCGVAMVVLVGRISHRLRLLRDRRRLALALVAISPLLTGALLRTHFDLVPTVIMLAALLALLSERPLVAFALLGVGTMAKFFPALLVPVFAGWLWARGERLALLEGLATFVVTVALITLPFALADAPGYRDAYRFQLDRPVQIESTPASLLLGVRALGGPDVTVTGVPEHPDRFKSVGLRGGLATPAAAACMAVFLILLVTASLGAARAGLVSLRGARDGPAGLVAATLVTVAAFAALGKVFSPQFVVWLVPLATLLAAAGWITTALLAGTAIVLTQIEFPEYYLRLLGLDTGAALLVAVRNMVLLGVVACGLWALRRLPVGVIRAGATGGRAALSQPDAAQARWSAPTRDHPPRSGRP